MIKKLIYLLGKLAIAIVLIIFLIKQNRINFGLLEHLHLNLYTLYSSLIGLFLVFCALVALSYRLWLLILFKRFSVTFRHVFALTLIGAFGSVVFPGLLGGDAVKVAYLCSNVSERRMDALVSVIIDRVFGIYSLFLLGTLVFCVALTMGLLPFYSKILLVAPVFVIIGGCCMLLLASDTLYNTPYFQILYNHLPDKMRRFIISFRDYLKHPKLFIIAILVSVVGHVFVVGTFIIAGFLLNDALPMFTHFILNPLAMVLNMVPLTPGGIGVAESGFSFLFEAAGSPNGAMVGLLGRFIQYVVFITGGSLSLLIIKFKARIMSGDTKVSYEYNVSKKHDVIRGE